MLDGLDIGVAQRPGEGIHLGGTHGRAFALADELDAFAGRIGALVELAGQVFDGEHGGTAEVRQIGAHRVDLGLAEDGGCGLVEQLLADALHVIPVDDAHALQRLDAQDGPQLAAQLLRLDVESGLLLHIYAKNHDWLLLDSQYGPHPCECGPCGCHSAESTPSVAARAIRRS